MRMSHVTDTESSPFRPQPHCRHSALFPGRYPMSSIKLRAIQAPLKERYRDDPASAAVVTAARSVPFDPSDPQHCVVAPTEFPQVQLRSGLHPAAGGTGDVPCSGDILAAALVICE